MNPIPIHAHNPGPITGDGNWTWLLAGRVPTLVDAGTGEPRHLAAVEAALAGVPLAQVLVTHSHADHASGVVALAERWPAAVFRKMPWPSQDHRWPVSWQPIADGASIEAGDVSLQAVHTPGHAPDHLCFFHAPSRVLFGADLAMQGGTVWIPTHLDGDLGAYLASLERAIALQPSRILPAHGAPIDDPVAVLQRYIEHRRERERQVMAALQSGDRDATAIVARIYSGLRDTLRPLARESVTAHLLKLQREGRVRRDGEAWHIIEP